MSGDPFDPFDMVRSEPKPGICFGAGFRHDRKNLCTGILQYLNLRNCLVKGAERAGQGKANGQSAFQNISHPQFLQDIDNGVFDYISGTVRRDLPRKGQGPNDLFAQLLRCFKVYAARP